MRDQKRVLAVDPGQKRMGVAISDPTATIATPLQIIQRQSGKDAAEQIARIAREKGVGTIVIGQALDWDREISQEGKKAARLAGAIRKKTDIPVVLWNEYGSTQAAREAQLALGLSREKRKEDVDHIAATVILQSYLDAQEETSSSDE